MSIYDEKFKNHPIHDNLLSVNKTIESFVSEQSEPEAVEHLTRLLEITNLLMATLNNLPLMLVPENTLNQLNKILNNINNDLTNFETSKDINQLATANTRADNLLIHFQQIPKIETHADLQNISEMIERNYESVNSILQEITKRKDQLEKSISDLSSSLDKLD